MTLQVSRQADPNRGRSRLRRLARWAVIPAVAAMMLLALRVQQGGHGPLEAYAEYHARCREAIAALPRQVGRWVGREVPLPQPALDLLDPNALRNVRFTDYSPAGLSGSDCRVSLMIVQCRVARDMQGHYPPRCYPAQGARLLAAEPRNWLLEDATGQVTVEGMEYHFLEPDRGAGRDLPSGLLAAEGYTLGRRRVVLNFLIVPGKGAVRDMKGVDNAAEDYRQRHRGAAQVQVVFDPSWALPDRSQRDAIAVELLSASLPALRVLADVPPALPLAAGPARSPADGMLELAGGGAGR